MTSSGDLWVWGRADEGQLGLGADVMRAGAWVPPTPMTSHGEFWASVQCGPDHCCAIGFDGAVYAWGDNTFGQCGLASPTTTSVAAPTPVRSLQRKGVTSVSCGPHHTVALTDDGTIYSTRIGQHGQGFQRIPPAHCFTGVAATLTNTIGGGVRARMCVCVPWRVLNAVGRARCDAVGHDLLVAGRRRRFSR